MNYCKLCMSPIEESTSICPTCGKIQGGDIPLLHLRSGTVLNGRYLVGAVLGEGGFGITYIGAIGPLSSVFNGTAPNIKLMKINFTGTNHQVGAYTPIACVVDFSSYAVGSTYFTSDDTEITCHGTSVQYYVRF